MPNAEDFRRIALEMVGSIESAHMAHPDFRANGRIFATIYPDNQWGMVKLTPEEQRRFVSAAPATFVPASGAWGRQGCTTVRLDSVREATLREAMTLAFQNSSRKAVAGKRPARGIPRPKKTLTGRAVLAKRPHRSARSCQGESPIDVFAMPHSDDQDHRSRVIDRVNDSVLADADTVPLNRSSQLFATVGARVLGEGTDPGHDAPAILLVAGGLYLFPRRGLDEDLIACHAA